MHLFSLTKKINIMKNAGKIKDVFADDLEQEMNKISELIDDYDVISMVNHSLTLGYRVPRDRLHE